MKYANSIIQLQRIVASKQMGDEVRALYIGARELSTSEWEERKLREDADKAFDDMLDRQKSWDDADPT